MSNIYRQIICRNQQKLASVSPCWTFVVFLQDNSIMFSPARRAPERRAKLRTLPVIRHGGPSHGAQDS